MRILDWDGLRNVRDLGGLPTPLSPSSTTSLGRIARGPRRELLTTNGWRAATEWGLRSIVDLRQANEVGRRDADPDAEVPEAVFVTLAPTEDHNNAEFREVCFPILDSPEYWQHNVRILPELVRESLEAIASSEPGVLIHCAAGRDRTGMVSALLLANAGVPTANIVEDYTVSVRAMAGTAAGGPTHDRQATWSPTQVDLWLAEVTPHISRFVADPEAVLDEIELDVPTRHTLRGMLTT